jgi:hypothetical protein
VCKDRKQDAKFAKETRKTQKIQKNGFVFFARFASLSRISRPEVLAEKSRCAARQVARCNRKIPTVVLK